MKKIQRIEITEKLLNAFNLVSANEKHQRPELVDKANQILRYLSATLEKHMPIGTFEPYAYVAHPALGGFAEEARGSKSNRRLQ